MRLLGLTGFYPPLGYGYGAICRDVMRGLARRGHDVRVLCAAGGEHEREIAVGDGLVHVPAAWRRPRAGLRAERVNQRAVAREIVGGLDAAVAWHMRGIGKGSLTLLHQAGVPVVYALGDLWVVYERPGPPAAWRMWSTADRRGGYRLLRRAAGAAAGALTGAELRPPPIAAEGRCAFASDWLRRRYAAAGFVPRHGTVVPNGIDLAALSATRSPAAAPPRRILFVGRTDASKGADIALDALAALPQATLTMVGGADAPAAAALREQVGRLDLAGRVELHGDLPRERILAMLGEHDLFLMPGRVEEGFGLVYLEAMAAGLPVVGTATGGAAEFCLDGLNAVVVEPAAAAVVAAVRRLQGDPELRARLAEQGRRTAERYSLESTIDGFEALVSR